MWISDWSNDTLAHAYRALDAEVWVSYNAMMFFSVAAIINMASFQVGQCIVKYINMCGMSIQNLCWMITIKKIRGKLRTQLPSQKHHRNHTREHYVHSRV